MSDERAQYDGDRGHLDEIVADNVTIHIEQMDTHHWMIRAYRPARWTAGVLTRTAVDIHLSGSNLFEVEELTGLPIIMRPEIGYCHEWTDRKGVEHACFDRHSEKARHKCDCGATTQQVTAS